MMIPLIALALTVAPPEPVADVLNRLIVQVDGQRVDVGPVVSEMNAIRVDLAKTLSALTGGQAVVRRTERECRVSVGGVDRLRMDLDDVDDPKAETLDSGRSTPLDLAEAPVMERFRDGGARLCLDVRALAQITGASIDLDGRVLSIFTPEWWARRLRIDESRLKGLNARSVGSAPEGGISPPARTMIVWVRPTQRSYVQLYKGLPGLPSMMLGLDLRDKHALLEGSGEPTMWTGDDDQPVQAETEHYAPPEGGLAAYAAVVAPADLGDEPVRSINRGEGRDWRVVGMRQRYLPSALGFGLENLGAKESLGDFAARKKMPPSLLLALNGYGERSNPKPGARLLFIDKVGHPPLRPDAPHRTELYEVRPSDTLEGVARRWKVPASAVCELNDIQEGKDLEPGQLIYTVVPGRVPPSLKPNVVTKECFARLRRDERLRQTSSSPGTTPIDEKQPVTVLAKIGSGMYYVSYGTGTDAIKGYLPADALVFQPTVPALDPARASAASRSIRNEALAHLGIRYQMGGNDLQHGIDCSHFVAAVLARSGNYAPSPPVSHQEQEGDIVHWKPGVALRGLRTIPLSNDPPGGPSLDRLQIGDRLIIQHPPLNQRKGGRHTGIYIGPYVGPEGRFEHAVVHAGSHGVAVVSFYRLYSDYRYTVHDDPRGRRRS